MALVNHRSLMMFALELETKQPPAYNQWLFSLIIAIFA